MMTQGEATIPIAPTLLIVGLIGVVLGLVTVGGAAVLYGQQREFSFLSTYLSDMGNTPVWPQAVFNAGMLIGIPVRFLFLVLLLMLLARAGASRRSAIVILLLAGVMAVTSIGMYAVPFSVSRAIHLNSALAYFFGVVALNTLIAIQEWRYLMPRVLPISTVLVLLLSLVFASLLASVGKIEGVTRDTPVIWEWLVYLAWISWLTIHSVVLGQTPAHRTSEASRPNQGMEPTP
jgi:hypothetical membrane protein